MSSPTFAGTCWWRRFRMVIFWNFTYSLHCLSEWCQSFPEISSINQTSKSVSSQGQPFVISLCHSFPPYSLFIAIFYNVYTYYFLQFLTYFFTFNEYWLHQSQLHPHSFGSNKSNTILAQLIPSITYNWPIASILPFYVFLPAKTNVLLPFSHVSFTVANSVLHGHDESEHSIGSVGWNLELPPLPMGQMNLSIPMSICFFLFLNFYHFLQIPVQCNLHRGPWFCPTQSVHNHPMHCNRCPGPVGSSAFHNANRAGVIHSQSRKRFGVLTNQFLSKFLQRFTKDVQIFS